MIATTGLPNAFAQTPYDYTLVPLGGTHAGYTFDLVSGTLPDGLELGSAGNLHGTPSREGSFALTVKVTDSDRNTDTRDLTLRVVSAARWEVRSDSDVLELADTRTPDAPKVRLTSEREGANPPQVSPDGSRLAYVVSRTDTMPERDELYVVTLTGAQPSKPELLGSDEGGVIPFAWSPDSKHLAFATAVQGMRSADVSQAPSQIIDVDAGTWGTPQWLTASTLGYEVWSKSSFRFSTLSKDGFSAPQELPDFKFGWGFQSAGNRITYRTSTGERWLDFDTLKTQDIPGKVLVSPNLSLVASNAPTNAAWQVTALGAQAPLVSWPEAAESGFVWSGERALFAVSDKLDILHLGSTHQHRASLCVDGLSPRVPASLLTFSPDGTWLFFPHIVGRKMFLSAVGIGQGQLLPGVEVAEVDYSVGTPDLAFWVSPDSRWLVTLARPSGAKRRELALFRLGAGQLTQRLLTFSDAQEALGYVAWAADSSHFSVRARGGAKPGPYAVNVNDEYPTPVFIGATEPAAP